MSNSIAIQTPSLLSILDSGRGRFIGRGKVNLIERGSVEAAGLLVGHIKNQMSADKNFFEYLCDFRTVYCGWPAFLDFRSTSTASDVEFKDGGIESENVFEFHKFPAVDFSRIEPQGVFYILRSFQDDDHHEEKLLDPYLQALRIFDFIEPMLFFAKKLSDNEASSNLEIQFRWRGLLGRKLTSWSNRERVLRSSNSIATVDEVLAKVQIPLSTNVYGLSPFVYSLESKLFGAFASVRPITEKDIEMLLRDYILRKI